MQTPNTSAVLKSMMTETQEKTSLEVKKLWNKSPHHPTPTAWVLFDTKGTKLSEVSGDAIAEGEPLDNSAMDINNTQNSACNKEEKGNEETKTKEMQVDKEQQEKTEMSPANKEEEHTNQALIPENSTQAHLTDTEATQETSTEANQAKNQTTHGTPMTQADTKEQEETNQPEVVDPKEWHKQHNK